MTTQLRSLDQIEIRLSEWILYLLRGGKPEVLERILESGAYPPDTRYEVLRSILTNKETGFGEMLRAEDRDLLIGANSGYALDLDPNDPDDRERLRAIFWLARSAKVHVLLSNETVLQQRGLFRDQAGRLVDVNLRVGKQQLRQLVGDLLSHTAENMIEGEKDIWSDYGTPAHLFDEKFHTLLRSLLAEPHLSASGTGGWMSPEQAPDSLSRDIPPYATQLLFGDAALFVTESEQSQLYDRWREELDQADLPVRKAVFRASELTQVDPGQALRLFRARWQIPEILGSYEPMVVLGAGQHSVTVRAIDKDSVTGQQVVLRILRPGLYNDCIDAPSLPSHQTILQNQRFLRVDDVLFLVTDYMQGGNLGDNLQALSGAQRFRLLLQALEDVCEALTVAHRRDVFHGAITLEKILFSPDDGRFKLANFQLSLRPLVGVAALAIEEVRSGAVQKDLHDLAVVFSDLLSDWQVPWLSEILEHCLKGGFANAGELHYWMGRNLRADVILIVLTALFNTDAQTIRYNLNIAGWQCPEMLEIGVNHRTISDLCARWNRVGELALGRAERARDCGPVVEIDNEVQQLLEKVSATAAHFVLGPRVRSVLEKHPQATLWVRYDPCLAAIPWELLDIGGSSVCRQFDMARSPLLVTSETPPGLRKEEKIRLLLIEDPDDSLSGATKECQRLRGEIKLSPMADRIELVTVDRSSDSVEVRHMMLCSDIIHFAGHGFFHEVNTEDSGLILGTEDPLCASRIRNFWNGFAPAPFLVFANACGSGRAGQQTSRRRVYSDAVTGLGQAFIGSGVANYIGTLWTTPDSDATIEFAVQFYRWFLSGSTVSAAIRAARKWCIDKYGEEDLTWARYVLFGHPLNRIEI